jgi:serine protease Do
MAVFSFVAACDSSPGVRAQNRAQDTHPALTEAQRTIINDTLAHALSATFRAAAQSALPSVVYVQVEKSAQSDGQQTVPLPEPFRRFFGMPQPGYELPLQRGAGSGFIIDAAGRIITNHHVVSDAERITVRLLDDREFDAEMIGSDPTTDVAVIDIGEDVDDLPAVELGDSEQLQIGDWVLALGNPLGLDFTVTAGIVSAKGRRLRAEATALEAFIQTDAAINQGNSGGPLINLDGEVMGINSAITGGTRFVGYGFAVPSNLVRRVVDDLLQYGRVRRPRLGVRISDVSAVDAEAYGLSEVAGAEINSVEEDSPADDAGIQVGDVIVALDGEDIDDATGLTTGVAQHQPGDRVTLSVVRDGSRRDITVHLGEFEQTGASSEQARVEGDAASLLGFRVAPLTEELAARFDYELSGGLIVSEVRRYSEAARSGISPGQVLLSINGREVQSMGEFASAADELQPGEVVSVRVRDPELGETIINYRLRQ